MCIIPIDYQLCTPPLFWTQFQQVGGVSDDYHATLLRMLARLRENQPAHPPEPTLPATTINVTVQGNLSGSVIVAGQDVVYERQPVEPPSVVLKVYGEPASVQQSTSAPAALFPDASDVLSILPPPFEWCEIPAGRATLENSAGKFKVQPFRMAKYPITYAQFQVFVDANDGFRNLRWWKGLAASTLHSSLSGDQEWKIDSHPRESVSWGDTVAFCQWLSAKLGLPLLPASSTIQTLARFGGIRLPTEWEWQWAAQGANKLTYPWGKKYLQGYSNINESASMVPGGVYLEKTTPVDNYPQGASTFGVLDMSGNVWEWCLNVYGPATNIVLGGNYARVVRGGAWDASQNHARTSVRYRLAPDNRSHSVGFRVCIGRLSSS